MQDFIGNLSRRTLFKISAIAGAVASVGSSATSAFAARTNAKGKGKMTYWNHFTGASEREAFAGTTEAFKKASPAIEADIQTVTNDDWMAKYIASTTAKSGPDALAVDVSRFIDMQRIGGLRDITTYTKQWPGAASVAGDTAAFTAARKVYGVPFFTFIDWGYYRKDLFEAAGIKKEPTTLEEFRAAAIACTNPSKGQYGLAMRGGSGGGTFIVYLLHAFNGPLISPSYKATLSLDAAVAAMRYWVNLAVKDKAVVPTAATDGFAQIWNNFYTGKAAMIMHHCGSFIDVGKQFKYGSEVMTLARPMGPKGQFGSQAPLANGVFQHTKNPDAAFEYISFLGSPDAQTLFLKASGYFPTSSDATNDKFISENRQFDTAIEGLKTLPKPYIFPGLTAWRDLTCLPEFQKCLTGTQTPEGAAKVIVDKLNTVAKAAAVANRKYYESKR